MRAVALLPIRSQVVECPNPRTVGTLERIPKWLNLVPMVAQWVWLSLRYGSATLPSAANPHLTCGGMVGDGKLEYFSTMGSKARGWTAPWTYLDNEGRQSLTTALTVIENAGLEFPLIAKPDLGWCGFGVRLVSDAADLERYLMQFPRGERIILQHFVPFEGEAGIYYLRRPGETNGRVLGMLLRTFPRVVGDGVRSIQQLMDIDPRLRRLGRDGLSEPCCDIARVPSAGESVRVAIIGSTRVGGLYEDASASVTPQLVASIDAIARDMPDFHVGRFDIRFENLDALRAGKCFAIIEVNGAGSEAVHAWDPRLSLRAAYGIVFEKQREIFAIGDAMRKAGHKPTSFADLARHYFHQQRLIRRYPRSN